MFKFSPVAHKLNAGHIHLLIMHTPTKTRLVAISIDAWVEACTLYRSEKHRHMSQASFLKSSVCGDTFVGNRSQQQSFSRRLKQYDKGHLTATHHVRNRKREFGDVEDRLVKYIELRERKYKVDKCGINWMTLRIKAQKYAQELGYTPAQFKASSGWIARVLERSNKTGISLHGEADDMTAEEREVIMADWRITFHELLEKYSIPPSCVYNADQTGLYYQKLPNRVYVDKAAKKTYAGVKQMKDKTRVTLMVCTSADGTKLPLSLVGKSKKPECFRMLNGRDPPLPYTNQKNAWFNREVTIWWIRRVLWPHHLKNHGDKDCVLLLDNCSAHKVDEGRLPPLLHLVFLPPNVTNTHQPADMGMIASLKVGYKSKMLMGLLDVFDAEGGFERAGVERARQRRGCRGLQFGGKATLLDAMQLLKGIWDGDGRYAHSAGILRCWRKANILPIGWETEIENMVGRDSVPAKDKRISEEDSAELCGLFKKCWGNMQKTPEDAHSTNGLAQSFADDPVPLSRVELEEMATAWVFVEDDPVIIDSTIDEELGIDGQGSGTGVDAGCVGDEDDEYAEYELVDECNEETDARVTTGTETLFGAEELIEQLRVCNTALHIPSDVSIHLDRFAHSLRRHHMATTKRDTSIPSYFKSI